MNTLDRRSRHRAAFVVAALLGLSAPSQAAIFLTDEALAQSQIYAANFPQVGIVYAHSAVRGWRAGSGTYAVNDKTVVTAAHILDGDDGHGGGIDDVRFYAGPSLDDYLAVSVADHWNLHPQYVPNGSDFGDFDIAVIALATAIPGLEPVELYTGDLAVGMEISAAGFGSPGTNSTGEMTNDAVRRAGTNVISGFGGDVGSLYQFDHPNFSFVQFDQGPFSTQTILEWQSSHGDSGGGWFVGNQLAAVNSFTLGTFIPGFVEGNSSGAVQIGLFAPWINEMAATSVPEPRSIAGLLTLVLMTAGIRRRSLCLPGEAS